MRKRFHIIWLACLFLFSGCGNFLDIKPVNTMIPVSVEDFQSLIIGGYPKTDFFMKTELMTDNVYANLQTSYTMSNEYVLFFTWAASHQLPSNENDAYWGELYRCIYYANSVLDEFKNRIPTPEELETFERVKGEAYALRAYALFYLVNLYAENYAEENLDKPGVPVPLTAEDVHRNTQNNVREPLRVVWKQICDDLDEATILLAGKAATTLFRFNYSSLQAFKARVYLFMGEWDKAIDAATDVMNAKTLFNMNNLQAYIDGETSEKYAFGGDYGMMDSDYKNEVLFFCAGKANYNMYYYDNNMQSPSLELLDLCRRDENVKDYRRYIFDSFLDMNESNSWATGPTVYRMYANQGAPVYYIGLKLSEMYVTRAEAYMRKPSPDREKAVADLNNLLKNRIRTEDFTPLRVADFADDKALLDRILEERRVETAFDGGLRWFDLRRLGKPEIVHTYKNGEVYTLKQGDLRYVLQIPLSEQNSSPDMPLNPRD